MIQPGTIRKMGVYYRSHPEYKEEVTRGVKEFFGIENILDTDNPLFNEWMMYDFRFTDGKGMLEKFYNENPMSIPLYRREIYKTLMENYYGFFEVLDVERFVGLSIKRIEDGKIFAVSEVSATMGLDGGDIFITRVAKVIDHYELVGSDTKVIKSSQSKDAKQKKTFLKMLARLPMKSPKDAMYFLHNTHSPYFLC